MNIDTDIIMAMCKSIPFGECQYCRLYDTGLCDDGSPLEVNWEHVAEEVEKFCKHTAVAKEQ